MTDTATETNGGGEAPPHRPDTAARRVAELEAENAALRRALADAGRDPGRGDGRHGGGPADTALPLGLLNIVRDRTAERRAEEASREAADHLRHTVELNPQIPWTADPEGRITGFGGRWLEATGLSREDAMGAGWTRVPHPDDLPRMAAAWGRSTSTGEPYDVEARLRMADGSHRWWRARAFPRRDAGSGAVVRWYGTTEDIHDRKGAEARLAALVELGDRLRGARGAADIAGTAGVVGRALGAARAGYGTVDAGGEVFRVERDWTDGRVGSAVGAYRLSDFWTGFADDLARDEVVAVGDVARDPRTAGAAADAYAAVGARALVNVAVVEAGRVAAILYVHDAAPRRWTAEEVAFLRGVAERIRAAAERARADARLAALAELGDRLRDLRDPAAIAHAAAEVIGRALGGLRAGYARVDADEDGIRVELDWTRDPSVAGIVGPHRLSDYWAGGIIDGLRRGEVVAIGDVARDPRTAPRAAGFAALGVRSCVHAPVVEAGRVAALLYVHAAEPRDWSGEEVAFVRGAADRAWAAAERARAEAALRAHAARQAFRLALEERLRAMADPDAIVGEAVALLGRHLGADRVGYSEIVDDALVRAAGSYAADGVAPLREDFPIGVFGAAMVARQRRGITEVSDDVAADPERAGDVWAAIGTRSVVSVPLVRGGRFRATLHVNDRAPRRWSRGEVELVEEVAARTWDAAERARAEAALRESEGRRRAALAAARLGTFEWDLATGAVALDERSREIFGFAPGEGGSAREVFDRIHPDDLQRVRAASTAAAASRSRLEAEYRVRLPGGAVRSVSSLSDAAPGPGGGAARTVGVFADTTDRRLAEERRALLVNELNHRVKNTLAVVQSLALQTARGAADLPSFSAAFQARLVALARAHDLLTREDWAGAPPGAVARAALEPLAGGARVDLSGCAAAGAVLAPAAALALALALHELATNALKHGALSVPGGRVSVSCGADPADAATVVEWEERGGPPVAGPPSRRGFGLRLLGRGLAAQAGMAADLRFEPEGVRCTLRLPPPPPSGRAAAGT